MRARDRLQALSQAPVDQFAASALSQLNRPEFVVGFCAGDVNSCANWGAQVASRTGGAASELRTGAAGQQKSSGG